MGAGFCGCGAEDLDISCSVFGNPLLAIPQVPMAVMVMIEGLLQQPGLGSLGQWVGLALHRVRYLVALGFLGSRWPDLSPRA